MGDSATGGSVFSPRAFKGRIVDMEIAQESEIRGCDEVEIESILSAKPSVSPPGDYIEFMRWFGRGAGNLFRGMEIYYPDCLDLNDHAEEFALEEDPELSTCGRFFFALHQGYVLYFFCEGNSGVWAYTEGEGESRYLASSFGEYVESAFDVPGSYWRELRSMGSHVWHVEEQ
ncbi:SMI1/KNR4 family protein [Haloactinospora alba]|uniref:SMI1/KNR4 family protein n=1 Tax=Haloactinospora alba TaxID=405555 RepID=UPI0011546A78|nr:SMI1/KNR4 family protein [Haloactinospora alba]